MIFIYIYLLIAAALHKTRLIISILSIYLVGRSLIDRKFQFAM